MKRIQNLSTIKSILIGVATYAVCCFALMIIETTLIYNGTAGEQNMSFISNVIHIVAAVIGCVVGKHMVSDGKMLTAVYIGVGDILLVLILKLLFSSTPFSAVLLRLVMVVIGAAIGCVLFNGSRNKRNIRNRKIRIR